nr:head maturation protease, ClpP-related [Gehongia tenuis]
MLLEGTIASETWLGDEVTPQEFRADLKKQGQGKDITVKINSPGGDPFAACAIYEAFKEYRGKVTVKVVGLAASAASVVAMGGDEILMAPGASMMIHKSWAYACGNEDELVEIIGELKAIDAGMIRIYALRTGRDEAAIRAMIADGDYWMDAQEAVKMGFADRIIDHNAELKAAAQYAASVAHHGLLKAARNVKASGEMDEMEERRRILAENGR